MNRLTHTYINQKSHYMTSLKVRRLVAGMLGSLMAIGFPLLRVAPIAQASVGVWSGSWTAVTQGGIPVTDFEERAGCDDPTNGGTAVSPDEADIASEADCTGGPSGRINPGSAPSMYYVYEQIGGPSTTCQEASDDWMEVRTRFAGDPLENDNSNFKGTIWFWWFDTTADGVADFYLRLNGANGDTLEFVDASFNVLWSQTDPLNTGYANVVATPEVPAGNDTQEEYFLDVQFPISAFGTDVVCPGTPLAFAQTSTAQEPNVPTAKDELLDGNGDPIDHGDPDDVDVDVVKDVDNASPAVGDTVTFTITVSNAGPDAATGVEVDDLLPAGLSFVSATPSQGSYDDATGIWDVGSIAASGSATLTIVATVDTGTDGDTITNTACVSDLDQPTDPDATDCDDAVIVVDEIITQEQADISVLKTASTQSPTVASQFVYTLTATNSGPNDATGVTVEDVLPTGVTYVSDNSSGAYNATTGIWTIGDLANGASVSIQITVSVNNGTATQQITNTACVEDADLTDPNVDNDCDDVVVTVQPVVIQTPSANTLDLGVTQVVDKPTLDEQESATFTVTVTNLSTIGATGVSLNDVLPAGLTFVSSSGAGSFSLSSGVWTVGALGAGNSAVINITASSDLGTGGRSFINPASLRTVDQTDTNPANNAANASVNVRQYAPVDPADPSAALVETGKNLSVPLMTGALLLIALASLRLLPQSRRLPKMFRASLLGN
jgi:uncharacterized repeat protein (TIGR01451 family)